MPEDDPIQGASVLMLTEQQGRRRRAASLPRPAGCPVSATTDQQYPQQDRLIGMVDAATPN